MKAAIAIVAGVIVVSAALADDATLFFHSHTNEVDFVERGDRLWLANKQTGIELIRSKTGFELTRLYGLDAKQDFLIAPKAGAARDLFQVQMCVDPKFLRKDTRHELRDGGAALFDLLAKENSAFTICSQAAKSVAWKVENRERETTLHLDWKGMDVQEQKAMLNVRVSVTLRSGDALSYWRIAVNNRSLRYGIERARVPLLHLAPIVDAKDDVLVYPKWRGGLVNDPFHAPVGLGENYHTKGAFYPYYVNMQFWALYHRGSGVGLYFGTEDPKPNMTHILLKNSANEIEWSAAHFPANIGYGSEDFAMNYDAVVGPFKGDWFDACQKYRAWATRQSWCAKGPLTARTDIPTWYKEAPLIFYTAVADSATGTHSQADNTRIAADDFSQWLKWAGLKLPVNWYGFEQETPGKSVFDRPTSVSRPYNTNINEKRWAGFASKFTSYAGNYPGVSAMQEFRDACKHLRGEGGVVCPYVCLQLFNPGPLDDAPFADQARLHTARDSSGSTLTYSGTSLWLPCVADEWWRGRLVDECTTLLKREGAGGFYLDVMHGMGMPCFWPAHGHAHAGADTMTTGMHELARRIREAVKTDDQDAITTGEDPAENMMDVTDGFLYQRTLRPENQAPIFAAVYQDYIPRYGLELTIGTGDAFFIECASLFTEGAQIGRLRLRPRNAVLSLTNEKDKPMVDFLGRVVAFYKQPVTKKFLVYGQLLRPLSFTSDMPLLAYGASEKETTTDTGAALSKSSAPKYPALMSGVFRAADGETGIFIVNASAKELSFEAPLEKAGHIEMISTDGSATPVNAKGTLKGSLPGRGIVFYHLRP